MKKLGLFFGLAVAVVGGGYLAGCSGQSSEPQQAAGTAPKPPGPKKPPESADENTWGTYLAEQGKIHGDEQGMRPYIYAIPSGDTAAAEARRKNEQDSIVSGVGHLITPGSFLILGGPDTATTASFVKTIGAAIKPGTLKDVTVLVVSDTADTDAISKTMAATEARLRVISM